MVKNNDKIVCEQCEEGFAVIIDKKVYKCADCFMLEINIPIDSGLYRLNKEGQKDRKKN